MKYRFPVEWKIQSFKKIADVVTGTTPSTNHPEYYGNSIPFIGPSELGGIEPIIKSTKNLSDEGAKQARLLPRESVLVCCIGATIGKIGFAGTELATNQQINALVCNKNIVFPRYVFHYCQTLISLFRHEGASTTLPLLPKGRFQEIEIPIPPIAEQKRIAEILDRTQSLISKRKEAIAKLDTLTQSIFLEMFGDPELKGWHIETVNNVVHPSKGSIRTGPFGSQLLHSEFVTEGIAVLGIDNAVANEFRWGERRFISEAKYQELKRYTVKPNDVIITIMGTCGKCAIVPEDIPLSVNTKHLCCITLNQKKCLPRFLQAYFLFHPISNRYLEQTKKGAIMSGLNMSIIQAMPIFCPPLALQKEFAQRVEAVEKLKATHRASLSQLEALFASLQHRAFRGEL